MLSYRQQNLIAEELPDEGMQVESFFRLQPNSYYGWNVVQTSLLDDLFPVLR